MSLFPPHRHLNYQKSSKAQKQLQLSIVLVTQLCLTLCNQQTVPNWSEWPLKSLQITNAGEDVEKRKSSYTVGKNVNCWSHYGGKKVWRFLKKLKLIVAIWSSNSTLGHISRQNCNLKRYMHFYAYISTIHNSQDIEAT